jgi:hypothetical protein
MRLLGFICGLIASFYLVDRGCGTGCRESRVYLGTNMIFMETSRA